LFGLLLFALRRYDLKRQYLKNQLVLEHEHTEKLQEIDRMKSRFFANISHEFRTPLTLLLGPISRLLEKYTDKEDVQDLKLMQKNAKRLQRLINELLDLSKIEEGKLKLQVQQTDIVSFVHRIVQTFESQAEIKKIKLTFISKIKSLHVFIDQPKIENVLYNLLSNAFKFTPQGGEVKVSLRGVPIYRDDVAIPNKIASLHSFARNDNFVKISISNTGPVIPADKIDHIFERFYQIDDSYTREHEGSGIGLALTRELVELHHGKIDVKSSAASGTTFSIYLPLGKEHFNEEEITKQTTAADIESEIDITTEEEIISKTTSLKKSAKLLVVEDNADMRSYIKSCFSSKYEIIEANDGDEGFAKSLDELPDLIISDVMMPKMDGFQLCEKLKSDQRTSHIPVILLTARAEMNDKIEGLETGADDYIVKPFEVKELQVRVSNLIRQRQKLHQKFMTSEKYMTKELTVTSQDEKFLNRAVTIIENKISDTSFDVDTFVNEIGISRAHLYHKFKTITGQSVKEFIRTIRLKRGAQLIINNVGNISEIAYEVGFSNPAYFSKCFREQFGYSPSQYLNQSRN
jgi:signal transduction histidine kinase/DNA-binding response OmpR family regulator